jgi:predicted transcriptional regulator
MKYTPQEIEVWYVLPAIRKELALNLKKLGLKQKKIANLLGITEPAVSQYIKSKRANNIIFNSKIKKNIEKSSKKIIESDTESEVILHTELQKILLLIKDSKNLCLIHKKMCPVPEKCNICINYGE